MGDMKYSTFVFYFGHLPYQSIFLRSLLRLYVRCTSLQLLLSGSSSQGNQILLHTQVLQVLLGLSGGIWPVTFISDDLPCTVPHSHLLSLAQLYAFTPCYLCSTDFSPNRFLYSYTTCGFVKWQKTAYMKQASLPSFTVKIIR